MVDYNIVKHCRACKKRFVVSKKNSGKNYCSKCQKEFNKDF